MVSQGMILLLRGYNCFFTVNYDPNKVKSMPLGENIKRMRQDKGWTQGELSKVSGVRLGHISRLERNDTDPKLSTIYRLIDAFGCSADSLLLNKEQMSLSAQLKASYERAATLPEKEKEVILDLIDKYCMASGVQELLDNGKKVIAI